MKPHERRPSPSLRVREGILSNHWLSIPEFAQYFHLKIKTSYSLAARGKLPEGSILRFGRQIRINVDVIEGSGVPSLASPKGRDR